MKLPYRLRRLLIVAFALASFALLIVNQPDMYQPMQSEMSQPPQLPAPSGDAAEALDTLEVKGRAPKTNYSRSQFGSGWTTEVGCDTRNVILNRDMSQVTHNQRCQVLTGMLDDPYTGRLIQFVRGPTTSSLVQIDHVVALSNAWQTGAQQLSADRRVLLANDPLEVLAVEGKANQQKSDGDAATWLPSNKPFRCQYVARQVAIKLKYQLWVTPSEKDAIVRVLQTCPGQVMPESAF